MAKTKILFITHEMSPFLELTKISEITRHLPQAMQDKGFEIQILMLFQKLPLYHLKQHPKP